MTDEFRLVLCEPVVRAKVAKAKRAKAKLLNRWQGPLEPCPRPEWDRWYHQQRGVIITVTRPEWAHVPKTQTRTRPARGQVKQS